MGDSSAPSNSPQPCNPMDSARHIMGDQSASRHLRIKPIHIQPKFFPLSSSACQSELGLVLLVEFIPIFFKLVGKAKLFPIFIREIGIHEIANPIVTDRRS